MTTTPPDWARTAAANIGRHAVMALVRTAAACMAGWSLYVVARHYDVPTWLAVVAGLVFDGVAYLCLRSASDAIRAARSAAPSILATLGMAGVSGYLNLVHADIAHGGRPAEVLYTSPSIAFLLVSAISWNDDRAAAKAARGESAFRLPSFGFWGWTLAHEQATTAVRERAIAHVTSGASPTHQPASPVERRDHRAVLRERFAKMDPADAVEIAADSHPHMDHTELAEMLATYGITVSPLDVAFILGRAVPTVILDRVPQQPADDEQPALDRARMMRGDAPQVEGLTISDAIVAVHDWLGPDATPRSIAHHLALKGVATDTGYIRTVFSRARQAEKKAAEEAAEQAKQQAEYERRNGNGGYA